MRITQLRSFHAVAHHGSVTRAAQALHVSQPTMTTQIRALEETYGVELFYRHGRGLTLTPTGRALYAVSLRIFSDEAEALGLALAHGLGGLVPPVHDEVGALGHLGPCGAQGVGVAVA